MKMVLKVNGGIAWAVNNVLVVVFVSLSAFALTSYGQSDAERLKALNERVIDLVAKSDFDSASASAVESLKLATTMYGRDSHDTAKHYLNLGIVQHKAKNLSESARNLQQALNILLKIVPVPKADIGTAYEFLAFTYHLDRKYKDAESAYRAAISFTDQQHGKLSKENLELVLGLANSYAYQRKFRQSSEAFIDAFDIVFKEFGPDSKETERVANACACNLLAVTPDSERKLHYENYRTRFPNHGRSDNVVNGKALRLGRPKMPIGAVHRGLGGVVVVRVELSETGDVIRANSICGHPTFSKPSEAAALESKFSPTIENGKPIPVSGLITFNFVRTGPVIGP